MHYYKRNIGDYHKKAGRLSMLQHGAYTLLLDSCYDREQWPTLAEAIEWTWASTTDELEAVDFVLNRFFNIVDDRYIQKRAEEEINTYKIGEVKNRLVALEREARRKKNINLAESYKQLRDDVANESCKKTHASWTTVIESLINSNEPPPNQEPRTINQEPKNKVTEKYSDDDMFCATEIYELINTLNPGHKKPNYKAWANTVRLMRQIDGRTHEQIMSYFKFANADPFWQKNILAPEKLRHQWDKLTIQQGPSGGKCNQSFADINYGKAGLL